MKPSLIFSRPALAMSLALLLGMSWPAKAFPDDEARRAILDLREQVHQMAEHERRIRLDFAEQIESLQQEVMKLRGEIEQLKWATRIDKRAADDASDQAMEDIADPQEQAAYEHPMERFQAGEYQAAIDGFDTFLDAYPDSTLAPEARFYRGSSQYAVKSFSAAVKGLREMIKDSPDHARAPDALLIIAASQIEMDDLSGAKTTLEQITNDYPDASAADTAKERLKLL